VTQVKLFFTQSATPVPIVVVQLAVVVVEELKRANAANSGDLLSSFLEEQSKAKRKIGINNNFFMKINLYLE
jgi:hypothetical protein